MYTADARARALRSRLLAWYGRLGRDLPWRRTHDPYRILVSEVMLQQTPVARVLPAYRRFLARFPTLSALRRASLGEVLVEWGTLGYPRRARDLRRAAQAVRRLPRDAAGLDALPGVGSYTAAAVACFSAGAPVAFADTNIRRVLGRVVLGQTATEREAVEIDAALLPRRSPGRWHQALMDLGATICVSRSPHCGECPVFELCVSKGTDTAPAVRRQAAFAMSDRRVRGSILRLLRERGSMALRALEVEIADGRVPELAARLAAEGLVEVRRNRLALPHADR